MRIMSCLKLSAGAACTGLAFLSVVAAAMAAPALPAHVWALASSGRSTVAAASEHRDRRVDNDRYSGDVEVDAPTTYVRKRDGNVVVEAPFTSVERSDAGVRVRAPFVDLWVPRR